MKNYYLDLKKKIIYNEEEFKKRYLAEEDILEIERTKSCVEDFVKTFMIVYGSFEDILIADEADVTTALISNYHFYKDIK